MGRSGVEYRVEYHGTDAEASLTSGRRPSGVGGYINTHTHTDTQTHRHTATHTHTHTNT